MRNGKFAGALLAAVSMGMMAITPALAATRDRAGKPVAEARPNVNKPKPGGDRPNGNRPNAGGRQKPDKQVSSKQAYNAGKNASDRNKRDVVVVNPGRPGDGYYDDGRHHHHDDWDDDDNDFLEFVGKTAAITAGVAAVSAVIGSIVKDKPDSCQPVVSGGQQYLFCNGVYYQQVSSGYQVVNPPS